MAEPAGFSTVAELEEFLARPSEAACRELGALAGDFLVLGAGGKIGPTLCRLLKTASGGRKAVTAVSRFGDGAARERLEAEGVRTVAADLLDPDAYAGLPRAENVWFLAGMKFGAGRDEPLTWAMNVYLPALVARHYAGSRLVIFSTGNVYPFTPPGSGGAREDTPPEPVGDYAQSCLGRERIFQYFSARQHTPAVIVRLNYANECRYGIIVDLTRRILAGEPVDLEMGWVNLIWQGDAADTIARAVSLAASPAVFLNVAGPETVPVRALAREIGRRLGRKVRFRGREAKTALLADARRSLAAFGQPRVSLAQMTGWIVDWVAAGRPLLDKPTKFQVRDGRF
jgi:nucleoside-diphosphate-sugar epimerase